MLNLFDVWNGTETRHGFALGTEKPRAANDIEVKAYLRWQAEKAGAPGFDAVALHFHAPKSWKRGQRLCIGATFGREIASGRYEGAGRDARWIPAQYENGAYSILMPGRDAHRQGITMETMDDAGEVIASQTLPVEPKKGGVIWDRVAVRKAAGPITKGKAKPVPTPVQVDPIADVPEIAASEPQNGQEALEPSADTQNAADALSGPEIAPLGYFVIDTGNAIVRALSYHATMAEANAARDAFEPKPTYPGNRKTDGKIWRYMVTSEAGPNDCRADLIKLTEFYHADVRAAAEAVKESLTTEPDATPIADASDPIAEIEARLADLEARVAALSVEPMSQISASHEGAEIIITPTATIQPKRTAAHERAIRRAWAERRERIARADLDRRALEAVNARHEEMRKAYVYAAEALKAAESERNAAISQVRHGKAQLAAARANMDKWATEARKGRKGRARRLAAAQRARRMILAARAEAQTQRQNAAGARFELAKLRKSISDPATPDRASDVARLVQERDAARTASAALQARAERAESAVQDLAERFEGMVSRVSKAEAALRAARAA